MVCHILRPRRPLCTFVTRRRWINKEMTAGWSLGWFERKDQIGSGLKLPIRRFLKFLRVQAISRRSFFVQRRHWPKSSFFWGNRHFAWNPRAPRKSIGHIVKRRFRWTVPPRRISYWHRRSKDILTKPAVELPWRDDRPGHDFWHIKDIGHEAKTRSESESLEARYLFRYKPIAIGIDSEGRWRIIWVNSKKRGLSFRGRKWHGRPFFLVEKKWCFAAWTNHQARRSTALFYQRTGNRSYLCWTCWIWWYRSRKPIRKAWSKTGRGWPRTIQVDFSASRFDRRYLIFSLIFSNIDHVV